MIHGTARIVECNSCQTYTTIGRFSTDPKCPTCGKQSIQTNKNKLQKKYGLSVFHVFFYGWDVWNKLEHEGRDWGDD